WGGPGESAHAPDHGDRTTGPAGPAPMPGLDPPQAHLQGHARARAADFDRASQGMGHIALKIARAEGLRFGKIGRLVYRPPTCIERLKNDGVARLDGQRGLEVARHEPMHPLFGTQMINLGHSASSRLLALGW